MPTARPFESAESASPAITRLTAAALAGRPASLFRFAWWERAGLYGLNTLPPASKRGLVRRYFRASALRMSDVAEVSVDQLVEQRLRDYQGLEGRFPVVVLGSALGGAAAHLAALLGAPFLPQPFILSFKGGSPDDSVEAYLASVLPVMRRVLERNREIRAIGHFDPVHDGWLTRVASHLRIKLTRLPQRYQVFIRRHLAAGGEILYLDCRARWPQFRVGARGRIQIGGWGGLSPQEFLDGSARLDRALKEGGSPHRGGWRPQGLSLLEEPESEWGSVAGLAEDLEAFADREGFVFHRLSLPDPQDFATLAYRGHESLYKRWGEGPSGTLVEVFTQYDPGLALRGRLLPLWLVFNTTESLAYLERMQVEFPQGLPVYFSALVALSRTPDMVPWRAWMDALSAHRVVHVGARRKRYPEDLVSLWRWRERLMAALGKLPPLPAERLPLADLLRLARS